MDVYGLIGYPLLHSFSISYFNQKFEDEGINARYENFEIQSIESLMEIIDSTPNLRGLNVTIPYKEKVISYLDALSPEARAIGAVNVIRVIHENNKVTLKGYNSDVIGFTHDFFIFQVVKWMFLIFHDFQFSCHIPCPTVDIPKFSTFFSFPLNISRPKVCISHFP